MKFHWTKFWENWCEIKFFRNCKQKKLSVIFKSRALGVINKIKDIVFLDEQNKTISSSEILLHRKVSILSIHVTLNPVHLIQVSAYTPQSYAYTSISLGYTFIKIYSINPRGYIHERVANFLECLHSLRSSQAGRMYPSNSCLMQDCEKDLRMWIYWKTKLFICHGFINSYRNNLRP